MRTNAGAERKSELSPIAKGLACGPCTAALQRAKTSAAIEDVRVPGIYKLDGQVTPLLTLENVEPARSSIRSADRPLTWGDSALA
jgi:hypothetical protein